MGKSTISTGSFSIANCKRLPLGSWVLWDVKLRDILQEEELSTEAAGITSEDEYQSSYFNDYHSS
jgi:hypothetical protein